jgi:hypothetical protein
MTLADEKFVALDRLITNASTIVEQLRRAGQPDLAEQVAIDLERLPDRNELVGILEALQATRLYLADLVAQPSFSEGNSVEQLLLRKVETALEQLTTPSLAGRSELTTRDIFGPNWRQVTALDLDKYFQRNQSGSTWGLHKRALYALSKHRKPMSELTLGEVTRIVQDEAVGRIEVAGYGQVARNLMVSFLSDDSHFRNRYAGA